MPPKNGANKRVQAAGRKRKFKFDQITSVMNSIGTAWVFVLLIIINLDIGGRALFNHPLRGVPEIVALSIVACVFLQIAHTLKVGRLTRSDIFLTWLDKKSPRGAHILQGIYHLVGALLMALLFNASVPLLQKAWRLQVYVGAEGDFMAPVWPVKLIILIGCLAAFIQFMLTAWQELRLALAADTRPATATGGSDD